MTSLIVGKRKVQGQYKKKSADGSSRISTHSMENIVNKLMLKQHRNSTSKTYLNIWRQFNKFVISLDRKPTLWEDRATLFIGYLIDRGMQSSTVKSYISAIKKTLLLDGYKWNDNLVLVRSLAKACKIVNDTVCTRLPIQCGLLEMILFEIHRFCSEMKQPYLCILYKTLFAICYYGMMRIGEVTKSNHILKAKDVHLAQNKDKILLVLYSSKTHDEGCRPQKIKITSNKEERSGNYLKRHFCPFVLMREYLKMRGEYLSDKEQFFIFRDFTPVTAGHCREMLSNILKKLNLDSTLYGMHSFRIGRTMDLIKYNYSIDEVKLLGRWKSNVIYKYNR